MMNLQSVSSAVSRLSPAEKAAIAADLEELDRRDRQERSRTFRPIRPEDENAFGVASNDQRGFIYSEADERWGFGGNRGCKTETIVQDGDMFCRGVHPVRSERRQPPVKIRFCAPKWRDGVEGVLLVKFKEVVQRDQLRGGSWQRAWVEKEHKLHYANGSWIQFKSFEEDLNTFGGADLDAVYQDEHGPESYYKENRARLADRNGFFCSAMTPEMGVTWEEDHVLDPPDGLTIDHWFFTTYGNPYLSKEGVEKFKASIKDPLLAQAKLQGQFVALSGLVLPQWNLAVHLIPDFTLNPTWPRVVCGDFHHRTPSAVMWATWSSGGDVIVYRCIKAKLTVPEWKKRIRAESLNEKITTFLGDEPGAGAGRDINDKLSIIRQFSSDEDGEPRLPFMQVNKGPGSFEAGIYLLWDYLSVDAITGKSRVKVFRSCDHTTEVIDGKPQGSLAWEMKRYQYKSEKKADEETLREQVRLVNDHYCDDLRYIVSYGAPHVVVSTKPKIVLPPGHRSPVTGRV